MKKVKKLLILVSLLIIIFSINITASPRTKYGAPIAQYKASEGFEIVSYSSKWNTDIKLKKIKDELLSNTISEEIKALKTIYIYIRIHQKVF